jgi:2-hydroxychromene-2-carboxylate isomerase
MEREAARLGLPFRRPDPFPQNSLAAARIALLGADEPWGAAFSKAVFAAEFGEGRPIADAGVLQAVLKSLDLDAGAIIKASQGDANKTRLKSTGEEARSRGLFGAPSFLTEDGELFWGNDRLDHAVAWAAGERPAGGGA